MADSCLPAVDVLLQTWTNKLGLDETRTQLDWDLLERTVKKLGEVEILMKQVRRTARRTEEEESGRADRQLTGWSGGGGGCRWRSARRSAWPSGWRARPSR